MAGEGGAAAAYISVLTRVFEQAPIEEGALLLAAPLSCALTSTDAIKRFGSLWKVKLSGPHAGKRACTRPSPPLPRVGMCMRKIVLMDVLRVNE